MSANTQQSQSTALTLPEGDAIVIRKLGSCHWTVEYWQEEAACPVAQAWVSEPETSSGVPCIDWLHVMRHSSRGRFGLTLLEAIVIRWPDSVISNRYLCSFDSP
jgi:hypothetical protein